MAAIEAAYLSSRALQVSGAACCKVPSSTSNSDAGAIVAMEAAQLSSRALQVSGAACCKAAASVSYSETCDSRYTTGRHDRARGRLVEARASRGSLSSAGIRSLGGNGAAWTKPLGSWTVVRGTTMESALPVSPLCSERLSGICPGGTGSLLFTEFEQFWKQFSPSDTPSRRPT